jgi:hypothetical protein
MLGLRANVAVFADADVKTDWDEKLRAYYRDDFLPRLAQNTGKHPMVDAFLARGNISPRASRSLPKALSCLAST